MSSFTKQNQSFLRALVDIFCLLLGKFLVSLMQFVPQKFGFQIASLCIRLLLLFMRRLDSVGRRNLELVFPQKTEQERRQILDRSYDVLANNLLNYAKIPELNQELAAQKVDYSKGLDLIKIIRERGANSGILVATLHFGSFELIVQVHAILSGPMSFLARGFGLDRFDAWWNKRRTRFGNKVFSRKGGYQEVIKRLKAGEDVGILFDQNVKYKHAVFVPFFGIPAATSRTIGIAALRSGSAIVLATCVDRFDGTYEFFCEEIHNPVNDPGTTEEKIYQITKHLHEKVEQLISKHPEQWFWIHRRFKTRPNGEPENLYD